MSKKGLAPIPGLHRVVEKDLPLAVKVTGRHLGAVAYLSSLAAERAGERAGLAARWREDGSLDALILADHVGGAEVYPGNYVLLYPGDVEVTVATADEYDSVYRPFRLPA